jgi:hypothetical protein
MAVLLTRFRRRSITAVLGALLLSTGCSLSTDPAGPEHQIVFGAPFSTAPTAADVGRIQISGSVSFIEGLGGIVVLPCLQAPLNSGFDRSGNTFTVRLIVQQGNAACASGPTSPLGYNVYITNVPQGTYTVRIVHEGDLLVPTGTVVKEVTVTVS